MARSSSRQLGAAQKTALLVLLGGAIVVSQVGYDFSKPAVSVQAAQSLLSPETVRVADLGFHAAFASFAWISTMPEVIDLFRSRTEFFPDLAFVNAIDPKLSYPYAFAVLTLSAVPVQNYASATAESFSIGLQGLAQADPDWRIPYYMATNYYLSVKDKESALKYYDIAARTPGVPQFAERFALNFGIGSNERQTTEELWKTIRDTTNDDFTKERAQAYLDRLQDFDYLEAAAKEYKTKFGAYPKSPDDLVAKGIIPSLPEDPFGFTFIINSNGTAGIDLTKLPSYVQAEPAQ